METWFKDLVFDALVKAALERLFKAVPFLGWGPIGYVVTHFAFKFTNMVYEASKDFIVFKQIEFTNKSNQIAFDREFVKLKILSKTQGVSDAEIKAQIDRARDRMANLVRMRDNSSS